MHIPVKYQCNLPEMYINNACNTYYVLHLLYRSFTRAQIHQFNKLDVYLIEQNRKFSKKRKKHHFLPVRMIKGSALC